MVSGPVEPPLQFQQATGLRPSLMAEAEKVWKQYLAEQESGREDED
jgi:hypothetical protein